MTFKHSAEIKCPFMFINRSDSEHVHRHDRYDLQAFDELSIDSNSITMQYSFECQLIDRFDVDLTRTLNALCMYHEQ